MKKTTLFSTAALLALGVTISASTANAAVLITNSNVDAKFSANTGPVTPPTPPGPGPKPINPPNANELGLVRSMNDFAFEAAISAQTDRAGLKVKTTAATVAAEKDRYIIVYDGRLNSVGNSWKLSASATALSGRPTGASATKSYNGAKINLPAATLSLDDTDPNAKVTDKNQVISLGGGSVDLFGTEATKVAKLFTKYQFDATDVELEVPPQSFEEGNYSSIITLTLSPTVLP